MAAVAKMYRGTAHQPSALQVKRNVLSRAFILHLLLSRQAFKQLITDHLILGNAYLEKTYSMTCRCIGLRPALARYVRREGVRLERYFWGPGYDQYTEFEPCSIIHMHEPDINQEVYGVPDYLGATQSVLLNENTTLFRRKYYISGAHAGFVMYVSDEAHNIDDVNKMREQLRQAKGLGNFKNLFMYAPKGKKDGVQIIPISDVASKDEFAKIKEVTRAAATARDRTEQYWGIWGYRESGTRVRGQRTTTAAISV